MGAAVCRDAGAVAQARVQVDEDCDCSAAASHRLYVQCALGVARGRVAAGLLPKSCVRSVKRCSAKSVCGRPGAVTCCLTRKGRTRCKVKKKAAKCVARGGCVGIFPSCCDACTTSGCRTTTTSTVASSSTTSSSTTSTTTSTSSTTTTLFAEGQDCLQAETGPLPQTEPLPCGGSVACRLLPAGDTDSFLFTVEAAGAVSIGISGPHNPCWQLFDPNGVALIQERCDQVDTVKDLQAGTHKILVRELIDQAADYVLSLQGVSESFHCGDLLTLPSDLRSDTLTPAGDTDSFNFVAQAGQVVSIGIAGDHNPCWRLFGPDGTPLIQERCDQADVVGPLAAGTHTIVVHELIDQQADYTLSLQLVSGP